MSSLLLTFLLAYQNSTLRKANLILITSLEAAYFFLLGMALLADPILVLFQQSSLRWPTQLNKLFCEGFHKSDPCRTMYICWYLRKWNICSGGSSVKGNPYSVIPSKHDRSKCAEKFYTPEIKCSVHWPHQTWFVRWRAHRLSNKLGPCFTVLDNYVVAAKRWILCNYDTWNTFRLGTKCKPYCNFLTSSSERSTNSLLLCD